MSKPDPLADRLRQALRDRPDGPLCVAFSGGPDSTALLHALAQLREARVRQLRAVHVDHGLHPDSGRWAEQARRYCSVLELDCTVLRVNVDVHSGEGLEAAARHARYAAMADALRAGEWLMLGHHREDQAETVLLKLLRGGGPEGLGGMREIRSLGQGQLWRPLLTTPRAVLRGYVERHHLPVIDDPSNADIRLSRNYLRNEILPRLAQHWPHAVDSILHSATHSRAAADALRVQWMAELEHLRDPATDSLDAKAWLALPAAMREPLLDHWLHARGLTAPTFAQRRQIERQVGEARAGRLPCIHWPGTDLHVWKDRLWALPPRPPIPEDWQARWQGEALALPDGGMLEWSGPPLSVPLIVRLRRGGERIRPAGDRHTRELRDLFQKATMPPWQRAACPLIYADGELIAVADRWRSDPGDTWFRQAGGEPCWRPAD
ncbi:tRNA lysidine(34) synthetase TilS [Dyella subtropica]|uniref:tRNA lysidine(34) synthetase TilS n=1 Tax=Dyella subtropica TaxID=2992127 RepID=UPI002B1CB24E|nr:tRNA lysidine(34) synthetase TilS [Dyella subtropica]